MARKYLRTSDVARAAGVHPNTVRLYERAGLFASHPRTPSGYRMYSELNVDKCAWRVCLRGSGQGVRSAALVACQ